MTSKGEHYHYQLEKVQDVDWRMENNPHDEKTAEPRDWPERNIFKEIEQIYEGQFQFVRIHARYPECETLLHFENILIFYGQEPEKK